MLPEIFFFIIWRCISKIDKTGNFINEISDWNFIMSAEFNGLVDAHRCFPSHTPVSAVLAQLQDLTEFVSKGDICGDHLPEAGKEIQLEWIVHMCGFKLYAISEILGTCFSGTTQELFPTKSQRIKTDDCG